ncbi:hypothetical protein EW026_g4581 [Hermanssonia centrifuga]|uniref:DUF6535 domain-containing protein n=1 Tax=Hermanssonia centrifuga TaxID=98765 RepID=A0A4V3XAA9_9APHY|nr:hypothetical protein EW026_g4581 [Hermanssonia centrifuga]
MSSDTAKACMRLASAAEANTAKQGWSAVEDYAWKYDVNSMKVFSEDIDTLLVFAGLFSAVLTAFVVPAYGMLQQDDSVQILSRISSKLDSFQIVLPFVNSTASACSCASDPSFGVSTSARWINILWFLSLLFSLASALFGILAKQWIREYLQWNQTIASPRENILVRQLRSEAWVKWKVPAGIAAIPALLEIAVVLFILGLVVLLWTLDFVVALIITIAAGILLLAAFSVTTLPAFFQHCPYKSPTGWACAFIYDTITRFKRRFTVWILKIRGCKYEDRTLLAVADSELKLFSAQSLYSLFDVLDKFKFIETSDTNPLKDSDLLDESGKLVAVITGEDVKENYQKLKNRVLTVFNTGGPSSNPAYLSQDDAGPPSGITDGFASGGDREGVINVDDTAHHAEIPSNFVNPGKAAEKGRAEVQAVNGDSVDVITLPFVSVPNNDLTLNASAAGGRAG